MSNIISGGFKTKIPLNCSHQQTLEAFQNSSCGSDDDDEVTVETDSQHHARVTLSNRKFKKNPNLLNSNSESPVRVRTTRPRSKSDGSSERLRVKIPT